MKKYIKREKYLKKILPFIDKDIIKVIVGQRRVGKSYFMLQVMDKIRKRHARANIIYIDKEAYQFEDIRNEKDLIKYIKKQKLAKGKNYLFIDEIQEIENFQKAIRSLNNSGNFDIYCTGSNADLLSGELATLLSGRYVEIQIYSLSYTEFLTFHKLQNNEDSFGKYLHFGGLPYLVHLKLEDEIVYDYLKSIYNSILLKDIITRYQIRNTVFLEQLVNYLADNVGSLVSSTKISTFLKAQKINIHNATVLEYLSFLEKSFFVIPVKRKEIQGKKIFESNQKVYFEDLGLRHSIVGYRENDINKILENVVFNHLKYLGYDINIGKIGENEIDFVAEKQSDKTYVQVAYLLNEKNKGREFGNLLKVKDNYPKYVVSYNEPIVAEAEYEGIKHIGVRSFLSLTDL